MFFHDGGHIVLAVADVDMLVDGDVLEEAETDLVAGRHHDGVVVGVGRAADHVGALHGGSGRAAADGLAAIEDLEELLERERVEIGVGEAASGVRLRSRRRWRS